MECREYSFPTCSDKPTTPRNLVINHTAANRVTSTPGFAMTLSFIKNWNFIVAS